MNASSGSRGGVISEDIRNDLYVVIPNPNGIAEKDIMAHFDANRNKGMWMGFINDCYNKIDDTLSRFGLQNPGAPGGRWGAIPNSPTGGGSGSGGNYGGSNYK